ncbi:MAG: serine/threonine-protein kinase [Kofleriaceae bacterium]
MKVVGVVTKVAGKSLGWLVGVGAGLGVLGLVLVVLGIARRPAGAAAMPAGADTSLPGRTSTGMGVATPRVTTQTPATESDGQVLGRYQLIRQLGAGGMAEVYLARSLGEAGFAKQVALKLLHPHLMGTQVAVDHFLDEARLASNLTHPNIVQIIDLGKVDTTYFIAMEYVDGPDLERVLMAARDAGRPVPLPVAMTILRRVCDGLDFAHHASAADGTPLGLVHRDVKSANVLMSKRGEVKVADFGIAKATTQLHTTQLGETKGTPSKMAPEQRMGNPVDARRRVPVAAIGYEIFTGTLVNLDLAHALHKGFEGWPHLAPPSQLRADLPPELDEIILGALAFEPEKRPASCHALEERLAQVASAHGLVADDKAVARWLASELGNVRVDTDPVAHADTRIA